MKPLFLLYPHGNKGANNGKKSFRRDLVLDCRRFQEEILRAQGAQADPGLEDEPREEVPVVSHRVLADPEALDEERRSLGDWWYRQEYLCEFVETDDAVFRHSDIQAALRDDVEVLEP